MLEIVAEMKKNEKVEKNLLTGCCRCGKIGIELQLRTESSWVDTDRFDTRVTVPDRVVYRPGSVPTQAAKMSDRLMTGGCKMGELLMMLVVALIAAPFWLVYRLTSW